MFYGGFGLNHYQNLSFELLCLEGIPKNKNTQHRQKNTYTNKNQMFETQWGYYKIWNILECCGSLWFAFILSQTLGQFIYVVLNVIW